MNTLHLFGDSFTEGHKLDNSFPWYKVWEEWRGGNLPPVWHELLSEKLGMETNVKAIGGSSNHETFHTICENCDLFKKDDIIIINWSYLNRFRWASTFHDTDGNEGVYMGKPINTWVRMGINKSYNFQHHITESTQMEIAVKISEHPFYVDEIYNYEKIIDNLCKNIGCDVYYWSMDHKIINTLPIEILNQKKYICNQYAGNFEVGNGGPNWDHHFTIFREVYKRGGKNIKQETNDEIPDSHLGESGHRIQSEMFYEYLKKYHNF
jgi:hypothetical protein